jgi:phosphoglycolate phosphatase-like HAD superfamily hydrolase
MVDRRRLLAAVLPIGLCVIAFAAHAQTDQLPSWNDGAVKKSITDFVTRVTTQGSDFVPVEQRIATFDNDGTLWAEQPVYFQVAFALDRAKVVAAKDPKLRAKQPFKGLLAGDVRGVLRSGEKALLQVMAVSHAGMSVDEFHKIVRDWLATARHPRFNRPYTDLVYQPMLELIAFLRARDFKTFIVSGGGIEFMRPWVERVYGIPPEQVVGSSGVTRFQMGRTASRCSSRRRRSSSSTTVPANRSASTASSVDARSSLSATPTAICRCCNGPPPAAARALPESSITPMRNANGRMIASRASGDWTRRWTKPRPKAGRSRT